MQIQLRYTRPIRGLQSFGLEKPIWSTVEVEEIQWENGFEVRVPVPKLIPQDIVILDNTNILSIELCKENLEQIKAWTNGEAGEKMWDFVSANDKVAFDGEYAVAFPTPVVTKLTKAQIAAQAKADAEREAAEATAAQAAADAAEADAQAEGASEGNLA